MVARARHSLALVLWLLCWPAWGQSASCLDYNGSWTIPYANGTIQAVTYFPYTLLLSVLWKPGDPRAAISLYVSVPVSVAQGFQPLTTADGYYNSRIRSRYSQALLAEITACPLLAETGKILLAEH